MKGGSLDWRRMFIGRDADMDMLRAAWRLAKAGQPQVVTLLGETGLGKTRIAQAFYSWLSQHADLSDPHGYWPDAFHTEKEGDAVNPRFPADWKPCEIPWLWWGIRFETPPEDRRNSLGARCGIEEFSRDLRPHVEPLLHARQRAALQREAGFKVGELIGNLIPGIGPAVQLFYGLKNIRELREMARQDRASDERTQLSPEGRAEQTRRDLSELALDAFVTILDPKRSDARRVPVVLLLDDAQWADPLSLAFVQHLLERSIRGGWPLLVIATHWEKEWNQNLRTTAEKPSEPQKLTHVFDRLAVAFDGWRRPQPWKVHPLPDAGAVADAALPGLTPEQRSLLLEKAGGNPLLLRELAEWLLLKPRMFVGENLAGALTAKGEKLLAEKETERHAIIAARFDALPDHVKRVLGWSSAQGDRFLRAITRRVALRLTPPLATERVADALVSAVDPHALIEEASPNVSRFRQRVFQRIAYDHLDLTPDECAAVEEIIADELTTRILAGEFAAWPIAERRDALSIADGVLRPAGPADAETPRHVAWARGLVALLSDYQAESLGSQARETALTFTRGLPVSGWALSEVGFWDQVAVLDTLRTWGRFETALLLGAPLLAATRARATAQATPESRRDLSISLNKVADVELALGRHDAALRGYTESLGIRRRLAAELGTPEARRDLSVSLDRVADVERALGRRDTALHGYAESLGIRRGLAAELGTPASRRDLSVSLEKVADVELALGRNDAALRGYTESLGISRGLAAELGTPASRRDLSVSLDRVADVELALGRNDAALRGYTESLGIRRRLAAELGTPESRRDLSVSLNNVADVELALGRHDAALRGYTESLGISRGLAEELGTPESRRDLSVSLAKVALCAKEAGNRDEARNLFKESLAGIRALAGEIGPLPQYLSDIAWLEAQIREMSEE